MIETDKPINAGQLSYEMGGVAVNVRHTDPAVVRSSEVDDATLQAAVDAHVANPNFSVPTMPVLSPPRQPVRTPRGERP